MKTDRLLRDGQSLARQTRPSSLRNTEGCPVLSYSGFGNSLFYPSIHETKFRDEEAVSEKPVLTEVNQLGHLADDKEWLSHEGTRQWPHVLDELHL